MTSANAQSCSFTALPPYLQLSGTTLYLPADSMSVATLPNFSSGWSYQFGTNSTNIGFTNGTNGDVLINNWNSSAGAAALYMHSASSSIEAVFAPGCYLCGSAYSTLTPQFGVALYDPTAKLLYLWYVEEKNLVSTLDSPSWNLVFLSKSCPSGLGGTCTTNTQYVTPAQARGIYHLKLFNNSGTITAAYSVNGGQIWAGWYPAGSTSGVSNAGLFISAEAGTDLFSLVVN